MEKFLSKYGLATHLAMLAALPLALTPFLSAAALGSVIFWLAAYAAVWLFAEPSVRLGEHLSSARTRMLRAVLHDPFTWFMLLVVVFALVRWGNSGIALVYDAEEAAWLVKDPGWAFLPSSVGDVGRLPYAVALASFVVLVGIRHGIGLMARATFGVMGSFVAGLGGLAAAVCAVLDVPPFRSWMSSGFDSAPFWASFFGVWLVLGVVSGAQAEARRWSAARLPLVLGLAGNIAALYFFAPPLVAVMWVAVAGLLLIFSLCYLARGESKGAVARMLSFSLLGFALPILLGMSLGQVKAVAPETPVPAVTQVNSSPEKADDGGTEGPRSIWSERISRIAPSRGMDDRYRSASGALSRIARSVWAKHPWVGSGMGAFELHAQFLAEREDWAVIPMKPRHANSGYRTFLAERGILGCVVLGVLLILLVATWFVRLVGGYRHLRGKDDADIFPFAVPPVAWIALLPPVLFAVEALFAPIFTEPCILLALVIPLALSAAAFPKAKASPEAQKKGSDDPEK